MTNDSVVELMQLQDQLVQQNKNFLAENDCYTNVQTAKKISQINDQHAKAHKVKTYTYDKAIKKKVKKNG